MTCGVGRVSSSMRGALGRLDPGRIAQEHRHRRQQRVAAPLQHLIDAGRSGTVRQLEAGCEAALRVPSLDPPDRPVHIGAGRKYQRLHRVRPTRMAAGGTQQPALVVRRLLRRPGPEGCSLDASDQLDLAHAGAPPWPSLLAGTLGRRRSFARDGTRQFEEGGLRGARRQSRDRRDQARSRFVDRQQRHAQRGDPLRGRHRQPGPAAVRHAPRWASARPASPVRPWDGALFLVVRGGAPHLHVGWSGLRLSGLGEALPGPSRSTTPG